MKKILLLTSMLLALSAVAAWAAPGVDIAWWGSTTASRCPVGLGALSNVNDACADAFATNAFSMDFKAPAGISLLVAETFWVDVQTAGPTLPPWWHLEDRNDGLGIPPGCRGGDPVTGQISSFSYATTPGGGTTATCKNYWGNTSQSGTTTWSPGVGGANRTRLFGVFARGSASAGPLTTDVVYWVGNGTLDDNHVDPLDPTVPFCDGCQVPACIVFNQLFLQQPAGTAGGDFTITTGNAKQFMTWQGGVIDAPGCPVATPTKKATWGQVKSLYR